MFTKLLYDTKKSTTHLRITKRLESYFIADLSRFFEFNLTPYTRSGLLQSFDTFALLFERAVHWWGIFFRRGINLNAQRKSECIPRVLVGPLLELVRSTSSTDCCCIFDDLVQTKRRGKPDCADREQAARPPPYPRTAPCAKSETLRLIF